MSSIPYNYGKYVDDTVRLRDQGTVDAGKQIQSPASAGSRGLAKTTQFTNDRTQMQMGNSPIAESMVEIRNILNRIDGVNVPVQEDAGEKIANMAQNMTKDQFMGHADELGLTPEEAAEHYEKMQGGAHVPTNEINELADDDKIEFTKVMLDISQIKDRVEALSVDEDAKRSALQSLTNAEEALVALDESVSEDAGDNYFDYENRDEYADNMEKYGDVDKTPLTPQERQQFAKWLTATANEYFERALEGVNEIGDDPYDLDDEQIKLLPKVKEFLQQSHAKGNLDQFADDVLDVEEKFGDEDLLTNDDGYYQAKDFSQHATNYTAGLEKLKSKGQDYTVKTIRGVLDYIDDDPHISSAMLVFQQDFEGTPLQRKVSRVQASESVSEHEDELSRLKELSGIQEDDNETKYYEYTGKAFAIRPSGESVWANKADIPGVINVESIMISHYPDMDDYVELTMEHDGPWEIYTDKAVEAALEKTLGMPSGSIKWSEQGQQEKGRAHFDVASTAIGKVAGSSMFKQVQAEESFKPFPEEDEMTFEDDDAFYEAFGELGFPEDENELFDAEYRGRKVPLNKPMRGDVKKFKVYVKDPKSGNVKKVNFGHGGSSARKAGQKTMKIRKSNPKARKSFRARHNCANPGPKTKARYWSCRKW
jgi:hypothetical protein